MDNFLTFAEYLIEKPLTPQQRMKRARVMKRLAPKIALKKKLALKKKAPMEKIKKRAEKKAKDIVRKKFSDGDYAQMSFAQKIQIDKKVEKKKALVKKIAKKLVPKMKKAEADRLQKMRSNKEATTSQQKEK